MSIVMITSVFLLNLYVMLSERNENTIIQQNINHQSCPSNFLAPQLISYCFFYILNKMIDIGTNMITP